MVGENSSAMVKAIGALFPTTCMASMVKVVIGFETNGLGVSMDNLN